MTSNSSSSLWYRLAFVPLMAGLLSMTFLLGYASNDIWPDREAIARRAAYTIPYLDAADLGVFSETPPADTTRISDPVADYRAAIALIRRGYYGTGHDTRKLTYEAIRGMLATLRDPFTSFMEPEEWERMEAETKGDFEGIGAYLTAEGHDVKIAEPIENSPAEKAGLRPDDIVISVNGKSVAGKTVDEVVKLIKGKPGSRVHLGILRGKQHLMFTITRARVITPVVKYAMEDPEARIGYIALKQFNERSMDQLTRALEDLKLRGARGLILDLRDNPGGLLEVAVQVASVFVPRDEVPELRNTVVFIKEGNGQETRKTLRSDLYMLDRLPLVVLVDGGSASASEIVTATIKDYGVGTIVGQRTYGKGRVQTLFPLEDNSALRLTTATYYPPRHTDINFKTDEEGNRIPDTGGIVPDIEVKPVPGWKGLKDRKNDAQLQKALAVLRERLTSTSTLQIPAGQR
ncbi:MAG: S41 family peptidase [Chloroherpetonaceae bacterium]|nr:S41 family peptidase [Chthonomonadaceae bacterium]MDW8209332.1 S41 family peptidase [Chloroherpetonaceae bacterium]